MILSVVLIWLAIGVLITPAVEDIMTSSGTFVRRSIFPSWGYLLLSIILAVPIALLLEKTGNRISKVSKYLSQLKMND